MHSLLLYTAHGVDMQHSNESWFYVGLLYQVDSECSIITHYPFTSCWEMLEYSFCIWPSSVSVCPHPPTQYTHTYIDRGLISPLVKLLLLMMGQWGLFVIQYYTPPPSHPHLPFTLQTSIFPWPSKTTPLLCHTDQARLTQLCIINILD